MKFDISESCLNRVLMRRFTLEHLVDFFVSDSLIREKTIKARDLLAHGDQAGYDHLKVYQLPATTPAAIFPKERKKEAEHTLTGIMMIDFDKINERAEAVKKRLSKEPRTLMSVESLSGSGVHTLVRCNGLTDENYKDVYTIIARYYSALVRVPYDTACSDFTRCMVINHDPNAYFNPDAEAFDAEKLLEINNNLNQLTMENNNLKMKAYLDKAQQTMPMYKGVRHTNLVSLASCMNQAGFDKDEAINECTRRFAQKDFPESEIRGIFQSVYTLYCAQHGTKRSVLNVQSAESAESAACDLEGEEDVDEEDYFSRVRCEQPKVADFYPMLPPLMQEMIDLDEQPCIQWLQFVAAMIIFSGMPVHTRFYAEGEKSLNLSGLIVGPSGSGKSKMKKATQVAKMACSYIEASYHNDVVFPSEVAHKDWEKAMKNARKSEEETEVGEEPVLEEDLHLMSSFTTSTEGLITRVAKNSPYTTYLISDEIGEAASTGKRDYGVKNDQRCKLIEGEDVSTDYKSSGYTCAEKPMYTELAAGTPVSIQRFLGNKEDGLSARYLYLLLPYKREYERLRNIGGKEYREKEARLRGMVETFISMCMKKYCEVVFSNEALDIIQDKIVEVRALYLPFDSDSDISYINRMRTKAMKMCGELAFMWAVALDKMAGGEDADHPVLIQVSTDIATMVADWIPYLVYTASRITTPLDGGKAKQINFQNVKQQKFYDLHPLEFTTAESEKIARSLHIQRRLAFTWRKKFCDMGIFEQVEHGKFKKCA